MKTQHAIAPPNARRHATAAALAVALAFNASDVLAFGFGTPQLSSALGQPLRLRIPVRVDPDFALTAQCLRVVGEANDTGFPSLSLARLTLQQDGAQSSILIESAYPVNEPALRVTVEAGCTQHVRRTFTVLLDPPESAIQEASIASSLHAPDTQASADLGLGKEEVLARVGQPLFMQIPVSGAASATLDPNCVHLAEALTGDGAPVLHDAKLRLEHVGALTTIHLATADPVTEPAVRVILEVGCDQPLRREYGVLLDMPASPAASLVADASPAIPAQPTSTPQVKPHQRAVHASLRAAVAQPSGTHPHAAPRPPLSVAKAAKKPTAPARAPDHLVLSSPEDLPDANAVLVAEIRKRVGDLTEEVRQLRAELAAEKQHRIEAAAQDQRRGPGWAAAILGLIGLAVAGLFAWQRRTNGTMAWNETSRDAIAAAIDETPAGAVTTPRELPKASAAEQRNAPSVTHEHDAIEVTELHDTVQSMDQLYTLLNGPGTKANAAPVPGRARLDFVLDASPPPPVAAVSGPPTVQSTAHDAAFSYGTGSDAQTPSELSLDLDLTTRVNAQAGSAPTADSRIPSTIQNAVAATSAAPASRSRSKKTARNAAFPQGTGSGSDAQTPTELLLDLDLTTRVNAQADAAPAAERSAPFTMQTVAAALSAAPASRSRSKKRA